MTSPLRQYCQYAEGGVIKQTPQEASDWLYRRLGLRPVEHTLVDKYAQGVGDFANGTIQLALHQGAKAFPGLRQYADTQDRAIDSQEKIWQAERAATNDDGIEWARMLSSGLPLFALPTVSGPSKVMSALEGIGQGGITSALLPIEGANSENFDDKKRDQVTEGAEFGAVLNPAFNALTKAVGSVAGKAMDTAPGKAVRKQYRQVKQKAKRLGRMIQDHVIEHPESVTP